MSVVAGAIEGAELGSVGGPLGAAAGAVVGGLIVLGLTHLAVKAVENANNDASSSLSDAPAAQPCADCGDGPDCFEPPKGADRGEFQHQLQEQQDEINKLSPDEMLQRLSDGDARKAETGNFRGEGDAAARQAARDNASRRAAAKAYDDTLNAGGSQADANAAATQAGQAAVDGKDATHSLDWVAGGDGTVSGVGNRSINRSIGSQWSKAKSGSRLTRREQLRRAAEKAKSGGQKNMNVELKEC